MTVATHWFQPSSGASISFRASISMTFAACLACSYASFEEEAMSSVLGLTAGHKAFITKQLHDSQKRFMVIEQVAYGKQMKHRQ